MASLRDIRQRIRSVKSTKQITKAMKMVAAAKLRKAQDAIVAARPYAGMLDQIIGELAARSEDEGLSHPLLTARPLKKVALILLTSDRGLAGGFNSNVIRRTNRYLLENAKQLESVELITVGRKGHDFFKPRGQLIRQDHPGFFAKLSYRAASDLAEALSADFLNGELDAVYLVFNEFVSAMTQNVVVNQLLPLQAFGQVAAKPQTDVSAPAKVDFKYEPSKEDVLARLVPQAVAIKLYRSLLESLASEQGARMSAMENATSNANDMISSLTLHYNRTRQAVITKELMEIVSGSEALK